MTLAKDASRPLPVNALPLLSGSGQAVGKSGRLVLIPANCTGCRTCELACSFVHAKSGLMPISRIRIHDIDDDRHVQVTCLQCVEAACVKVCPAEALVRNEETGAIEVLAGRCVGCGLCEAACPFGHMHFDTELKLAVKCDLCGGTPTCAAFCPHNALEIR